MLKERLIQSDKVRIDVGVTDENLLDSSFIKELPVK